MVRERVPQRSNLLGVFEERLQISVKGVRLPDALRRKDEPEHTISASPRSNREGEQGLDPFDVFPRFFDASGLEFEVVQTGLVVKRRVSDPILEEGFDLSSPDEGAEVPCQG